VQAGIDSGVLYALVVAAVVIIAAVAFWLPLAVVGGAMLLCGAVFVSLAWSRKRRCE